MMVIMKSMLQINAQSVLQVLETDGPCQHSEYAPHTNYYTD